MISAAAALLVAAPSAWLPPRVVGEGWGLNLGFNDLAPIEQKKITEAGMRWVRRDLFWHVVEPEKGKWDWAIYDRLLSVIEPRKIRPVFILCYGNGHYQPDSPRTPEARAGFVNYVRKAVDRYKGRGVIWEMWNEPNNHHWQPQPNVKEYIQLALETGKAFKEAAPQEKLVGPALAAFDWPFIEACFKAGVLRYWDGVTVHPYRPMEPETAAEDYARLKDLIRRYAPPGKEIPILCGEWGYSDVNVKGEDQQGQYFVRQYLSNLASNVPLTIWYNWSDNGPDPRDPEHHFGVVRQAPGFEDKPAIRAARGLTRVLKGYRYSKRLAYGSSSDWILLFNKGQDQALAAWTTSIGGAAWPAALKPALAGQVFDQEGRAVSRASQSRLGAGPLYIKLPKGWKPGLSRVPELPLALSVSSPAQMVKELGALAGKKAVVSHGSFRASMPLTAARLASLPRFGDRSGSSHRVVIEVNGTPQAVVLRHSAPLEVDLTAGGRGAELRVLAQTQGVRGTMEVKQGSRVVTHPIRLGAGESVLVQLPSSTDPVSLVIREGKKVVRKEGPLVLTPAALAGSSIRPEGDPKVSGEVSSAFQTASDGPAKGAPSARLSFNFGKGWKYGLFDPAKPQVLPGRPMRYSVWAKGDGSGVVLLVRVVDSSGQTFQPEGIPVNWKGWKLVSFPLDGSTGGRWGGPNDGVQRLPLTLASVAVLDNPSGAGVAGEIELARPTILSKIAR